MPLIKENDAVNTAAAEAALAAAEASKAAATAEVAAASAPAAEAPAQVAAAEVAHPSDNVLDNGPEPETAHVQAASAGSTAVAPAQSGGAVAQRQAAQTAVLTDMAQAGFEGLTLDYTSFPNIVLKDGEFQVSGSNRTFDAKLGFDGIITTTRKKFAMRVGGDEDGDVAFADQRGDFDNVDTEVGRKVQEWRASGLKPELKEYIEAYVMITAIGDHESDCQDLVGGLVVVQISPTSCGRFSGYVATQAHKYRVNPDGYETHFYRGEKITNAKFPFYPWAFKFNQLN